MRPGRRAWAPEDDAALKRMASAGYSVDQMAVMSGRTVPAVYSRCHNLGIHLAGRKDASERRRRNRPDTTRLLCAPWWLNPKKTHAMAWGRWGGIRGGPARASKLTAEQLSEIGRKGAAARWRRGA